MKPRCEIVAALRTDVGCARDGNEDCARALLHHDREIQAAKGVLIVVADGMGGHEAGEVASRLAVDRICHSYYESYNEPALSLVLAFRLANAQIHATAKANRDLLGMGTTCAALAIVDHGAYAAYVGDTRIYLIRDSRAYVMTEDHSAVMEQVRSGQLNREEARHHADRNVVLRALGCHPEVEIGRWERAFPVRIDDRFVVCSDGLHDVVSDEEIRDSAIRSQPHDAAAALIDLARDRGGPDNITVAVVHIQPCGKDIERVKDTREREVGV